MRPLPVVLSLLSALALLLTVGQPSIAAPTTGLHRAWTLPLGGPGPDHAAGVVSDGHDGAYVAYTDFRFAPEGHRTDLTVAHVLAGRRIDWLTRVPDAGADDIALGPGGDIYLAGVHVVRGPGSRHPTGTRPLIVRLNPRGHLLAQRTYAIERVYGVSGLAVGADGRAYLAAQVAEVSGHKRGWLLAVDADLGRRWVRAFGRADRHTRFDGVAVAEDGSLYAAGSSTTLDYSLHPIERGHSDLLLTKVGPAGRRAWTRTIGRPQLGGDTADTTGRRVLVAGDRVIAVGDTGHWFDVPEDGSPVDLLLASFDSDGTRGWLRITGAGGTDTGDAAALEAGGGFSVAGDMGTGVSFGVTQFDARGRVVARRPFPRYGAAFQVRGLAIGDAGAYVVGTVRMLDHASFTWDVALVRLVRSQ